MIHEGRVGASTAAPVYPVGNSQYHHGSGGGTASRRPPQPSPPGSPTGLTNPCRSNYCFRSNTPYREPLFCCCYNCPAPTSFVASFGICCLVIGYTLMGAFTFMSLEGNFGSDSTATIKTSSGKTETLLGAEIRSRTVDKLWSITEDLNILYKENWTRLAAQEVMEFQDSLVRALRMSSHSGYLRQGSTMFYYQAHRWTFSSSFLYSLTLITTIGYGNMAPRTPLGKLTTILYAVIGIPLMLIYLSTMGEVLARSFRQLYGRMCGVGYRNSNRKQSVNRGGNNIPPQAQMNHVSAIDSKLAHYYKDGVILNCHNDMLSAGPAGSADPRSIYSKGQRTSGYCSQIVAIPVSLCILIIVLYIICGAVIFNRLENWTLLEGSYFCFASLGTIGFGDLVPGEHSMLTDEISHCVCSAYILIGMALIAMCFNLVQEEITTLIRSMGRLCGSKHDRLPSQSEFNSQRHYSSHHYHCHADGCEEISMSVVS